MKSTLAGKSREPLLNAADVQMLFEFPRIIRQLHQAIGNEIIEQFGKILDDEPDLIFDPLSDTFNFSAMYATETGLFYELGYRQNGEKILCGLTLSLEADSDDVDVFETGMTQAADEWPGWTRESAIIEDENFVLWHRSKSLNDFFSDPNPLQALQRFFKNCLDELQSMKRKYPALPW
jgi:hypothetical protein